MVKCYRKTGVAWALRRILAKPPVGYVSGTVAVDDYDHEYIRVYVFEVLTEEGATSGQSLRVDRKTAKLLAKRINQCLDET